MPHNSPQHIATADIFMVRWSWIGFYQESGSV